ncbi:MAG: gamma carbonic anhydrase family protein [Dehalococcoidia bacterium]|nr:gamma carbonic anhydrase family protein [SAR202 cluster bacterium]MCS5650292.1 gamma carbonic anhydrase family protein [Dehalococcoidia bacterium]MEC7914281.1 gamma carbonic anhydrase family protein [Chloroflexota bacterium]
MLIKTLEDKTPLVHPTAFVSEAAYVVGDVEIGEGSSIWPGTVIRGDMGKVRIGKYTNIQDNSVVHGDDDVEIGDYVIVGHRVMCHAKYIGDQSLIGNGAIINDGVIIGKNSVVGSGTMVLENMDIPERSIVVGMPGRVRGEIQQKHLDLQVELADIYSNQAKRYKKEGTLE